MFTATYDHFSAPSRFFLFTSILVVVASCAAGQSLISGDIAGAVTDPSGGVVPKATVTLKSLDQGDTQVTTTNQSGSYRFSLLKPGRYSVSASAPGFQTVERQVDAGVGQTVAADLTLTVGQTTQTVEVVEAQPVLSADASINTAFSPREVELLPSAGSDITNIAFTVPGVVVSVNNDYGNFSANGLPATSNLFTINGENYMDPYFNINNSGASNLSLGQNETQEATIITNPYGAQYGTFSGAQVTYVTMSGTNQFHGNAIYWWNGRDLNANDWFNNFYGDPRPFSNANQWAARLGGPIIKNKTFFFVDTEGLRFVLPDVISATIPTQAFANAVLSNIAATQPNELSAYKSLFNLWDSAPGSSSALPLPNSSSCASLTLPGFNPATQRCAEQFEAAPSALASEWILTARVDQKLGDKDNAFYRYRLDHGLQPTHIDPISPAFDALSNQPQWDNQFTETHIFGPRSTNQFLASFSHYVAQFAQNHQLANSTFPYDVISSGSVDFAEVNPMRDYPQGRNITQYQFIDDYSIIHGSHNLKFGANFRRYDVSDHNFYYNYPAVYFGYTNNGMQNFVNGLAYQYRQSLNLASDVPVALWGLGMYANDDWRVNSRLKLTLGFRIERNSNPVCQFNCFANFKSTWTSLASVTGSNPSAVPYSSDINYNQHQAFQGVDAVNLSPRIGFSWSPMKDNKTVVSGGFGIFYDALAAGLVDDLLTDPPVSVAIRVRPSAGVLGFDPAGGAATWAASASAFNIQQTFSQLSGSLAKLGSVFSAPSFDSIIGTVHAPMVEEWNFQVQRQLSGSTAFIVNYVGNHASRLPYGNSWPNAYDEFQLYPGIKGVPSSPAVANYGTVQQFQSGAISNYDGLNVTLRKQLSHSLMAHFNYTWSHALDEISNGGVFQFNNDSLLGQINPLSLRANNYGNADYDIRNNMSADFVYTPTFHSGNAAVRNILGGWQVSGKIFWRSGLPFSVTDGNTALGNFGGTLLGTYSGTGGAAQTSCGAAAAITPCVNANAFVNAADPNFSNYTSFSTQTRNQFRGPHYFDMDLSLYRTFKLKERLNLSVGMQAFNLFNHPNFNLPDNVLGDATFGQILSMASTPTSAYGNFLGFDSSPRVVQLTGKIVF
jgi:hypothetical protein